MVCWHNSSFISAISTSPPTSEVNITSSVDTLRQGFTWPWPAASTTCNSLVSAWSSLSPYSNLPPEEADALSNFSEIAAITAIGPDHVKTSLGGHVTGELSTSRDSYITRHLNYLTRQVTGRYRCTVHGMDSVGHPESTSASTVIKHSSEDAGDDWQSSWFA